MRGISNYVTKYNLDIEFNRNIISALDKKFRAVDMGGLFDPRLLGEILAYDEYNNQYVKCVYCNAMIIFRFIGFCTNCFKDMDCCDKWRLHLKYEKNKFTKKFVERYKLLFGITLIILISFIIYNPLSSDNTILIHACIAYGSVGIMIFKMTADDATHMKLRKEFYKKSKRPISIRVIDD